MLKEISLSDLNKSKISKKDCILVARRRPRWIKRGDEIWHEWNVNLAPSIQLLSEFLEKCKEYGKSTSDIHNRVFKDIGYEKRFREQILSNRVAMEKLQQISVESKEKDIYLVCYEGPTKACHRRILLRLCERYFNAKIKINGIEP